MLSKAWRRTISSSSCIGSNLGYQWTHKFDHFLWWSLPLWGPDLDPYPKSVSCIIQPFILHAWCVKKKLESHFSCWLELKSCWLNPFVFTVKPSEIHPPLAPTGLGIGRIVMPKAMQMRATHHEIGLTNLSPGRAEPCPFGWCKKWEKCGRESGQTHGFSQ